MKNFTTKLDELIKEWDVLVDSNDIARQEWEDSILNLLYPHRFDGIGEDLNKIINIFNQNDRLWWNLPGDPSPMTFYKKREFNSFMDYFTREIEDDRFAQIKENVKTQEIVMPDECDVESTGMVEDLSTIIRLKKPAEDVVTTLLDLGCDIRGYRFINMKLLLTYYHRIHSPVAGTVEKIIEIPKSTGIFGNNTLWVVDILSDFGHVYMMLVGECLVQDFNFKIKEGDTLQILDELGNFSWGSQVVLFFDELQVDDLFAIKARQHYFVGDNIMS